jgi:hypothetical protein
MNWTELLAKQAEGAYRATEGLLDLVDADRLSWKPATGENWLTMAQLLKHITGSCGAMCEGFVTGDWGVPAETFENLSPEEMLPPAEKFPALETMAEAKEALAVDKKLALKMIAQAGEQDLANKVVVAPWDPRDRTLGERLLESVAHLDSHKAQLFYYLKLQGVPVNTGHLWGM